MQNSQNGMDGFARPNTDRAYAPQRKEWHTPRLQGVYLHQTQSGIVKGTVEDSTNYLNSGRS